MLQVAICPQHYGEIGSSRDSVDMDPVQEDPFQFAGLVPESFSFQKTCHPLHTRPEVGALKHAAKSIKHRSTLIVALNINVSKWLRPQSFPQLVELVFDRNAVEYRIAVQRPESIRIRYKW